MYIFKNDRYDLATYGGASNISLRKSTWIR